MPDFCPFLFLGPPPSGCALTLLSHRWSTPTTFQKLSAKSAPPTRRLLSTLFAFFPVGDYVWLPPKELKCLTTADIKVFVGNAGTGCKSGDTMEGYHTVCSFPSLVFLRFCGGFAFPVVNSFDSICRT
ncbi:hypothetical protein B0H17DRAFT_1069274 [Mycena rosella]|uniref:Uncharacterized protein n=1 Tax=Mycena rosella TaxID=1033263 RepID=A0AAD7DDR7_MYCRO|nr:hypothetical protein B0H17DRAFT_1069274 [Mycena rosella]